MISVTDLKQFCNDQLMQWLRLELANDLEAFLAEPPPKTLKDYLPKRPLVLSSGYTTNPQSTTFTEVEIDEAS